MKITTERLKKLILEELEGIAEQPASEPEAEAPTEPGKVQQMIAAKLEPATQLSAALKLASRNVQTAQEAIEYWLGLLGQSGLDSGVAMQALKKVLAAKSKEQ